MLLLHKEIQIIKSSGVTWSYVLRCIITGNIMACNTNLKLFLIHFGKDNTNGLAYSGCLHTTFRATMRSSSRISVSSEQYSKHKQMSAMWDVRLECSVTFKTEKVVSLAMLSRDRTGTRDQTHKVDGLSSDRPGPRSSWLVGCSSSYTTIMNSPHFVVSWILNCHGLKQLRLSYVTPRRLYSQYVLNCWALIRIQKLLFCRVHRIINLIWGTARR